MNLRCSGFALGLTVLVALFCGCGKKDAASGARNSSAPADPFTLSNLSRVHWVGRQQLATETNAALPVLWNLPESTRIQSQTLDKLALAPWRLFKGDAATNGAPTAALRALLDDIVLCESFVEIHHVTNHSAEFLFAIRVTEPRAALWQTNLGVVIESLTGIKVVPAADRATGWSLKKHDAPEFIQLRRAGAWTLVSLTAEASPMLAVAADRVAREGAPFAAGKDVWLEVDLDLRWLAQALAFNWSPPPGWPRLALTMIGNDQSVRTRGQLDFPAPLNLVLEPWSVPTNLIHDPLVSFTAARGVQSWLAATPWWSGLSLGTAPNQLYSWALEDIPFQTYFSAIWPESSNRFYSLTEQLLRDVNPRYATNDLGHFERLPNLNGVAWKTVPFFAPFLQHDSLPEGETAFGGFFALEKGKRPIPPELIVQLSSQTNLVYYDWEITDPRVGQLTYLVQLLRWLAGRAQIEGDSAGMKWFQALAPKLGNAVTAIKQTGPSRLTFSRTSGFGFTAIELHLLADWFEGPNFPRGLHTFDAPVKPLPKKRPATSPGTNAPAKLSPAPTS